MMNKQPFTALSRTFSRLTTARRSYPIFDAVVLAYIALVLLVQVLFQISPAVTFFASTPLINIQTWLGLAGGALLAVDLFTTKRLWQGPYCLLLYGILALAVLASVRTLSYGVKENLYKLCWAAIQYGLFYSCSLRMETEKLKKYIKVLFSVLLVIWLAACCVSLYQFARLIGYDYVVNPMAQDASSNRQGFYDNRLFGIFYTLNHAAYGSLLFFLLGLVYAIRSRRVVTKVLLSLSGFILLLHMVASRSRSALLALPVCLFCLTFLAMRSRLHMKSSHRLAVSALLAALVVGLSLVTLHAMKVGLTYIPDITAEAFDLPDVEYEPDLFDREMDENASNGRFSIWSDYLSLAGEIGPIGISPGNYMPYIYENHQDLYIVDFIRTHYPDRYASRIVYHMHSGYLMVYVSTGWIGTALLLAFGTLCILRLFAKLKTGHKTSYTVICLFLLVAAVAISAVFDEGIFFQNNPQTSVFWIALGFLMQECGPSQKETLPEQSL